jgi:hypothetical protein
MVNIHPGVGVYGMFPSFDYKPWLAIAELLDNSITSYQQNRAALEALHGPSFRLILKVTFDKVSNDLVISDNAAGITAERFPDAFALARPPEDIRFISRYGVGMKAAACWFAREWTLRTSAIGENVERIVHWSTSEITEKEIADLPVEEIPVGSHEHYTVISLHNLLHPVNASKTSKKIEKYLPHIFREFIAEDGVEIYWNGNLLEVETPEVLEAPPFWDQESAPRTWSEDVHLRMHDGRVIRGRVFLLQKMKRGYTALNLFWHRRLIQGNIEPIHRPTDLFGGPQSFETGRLCVELHLDEYEPTVDKKGFKFLDNESSLEDIIDALKEAVPDLIRQAREYRALKVDTADGEIPDIGPIVVTPGGEIVTAPSLPTPSDPYPPQPTPTLSPPSSVQDEELPRPGDQTVLTQVEVIVDDQVLKVLVRLDTGPGANRFVELRECKPSDSGSPWTLFIDIGTQHPFFLRSWSEDKQIRELIMVMASAIGFGEIAARRAGAEMPSFVRSNIDQFLRLAATRASRN